MYIVINLLLGTLWTLALNFIVWIIIIIIIKSSTMPNEVGKYALIINNTHTHADVYDEALKGSKFIRPVFGETSRSCGWWSPGHLLVFDRLKVKRWGRHTRREQTGKPEEE